MNAPVRRVASRWVELEVTGPDDDGLFTWTRRPGSAGPDRFDVVTPEGHRPVRRPPRAGTANGDDPDAGPPGGVVLLDPDATAAGPGPTWRPAGPSAAAGWLFHPDPTFRSTGLRCVLSGWRTVRGLRSAAASQASRRSAATSRPSAPVHHGTAPDGFVPDGTAHDEFVPDGFAHDEFVPDGFAPDGAVHDGFVPDGTVLRPPPGDPAPLRRLADGLADDDPPPDVRDWRAVLDSAIRAASGPGAAREGRSWLLDELSRHRSRATHPAHGGLSVGNLVPATTGYADVLLTGEDWGWAPPGHDAGWLLGELTELRAAAAARDDQGLVAGLSGVVELIAREAVADGADPADLRCAAALRIALHAEDYARFVGFDETGLRTRARLLAKAQVGRGTAADPADW